LKITAHIFDLKNKGTFRVAHGARTHTETFIISIEKDGLLAYGEATPVPYYGITAQSLKDLFEKHKNTLKGLKWEQPSEYWEQAFRLLNNTFLTCALDIAIHDLWAQSQGKKLYEALGLRPNHALKSNFTIGIDEIELMVEKIKEVDFPLYKIKLGTEHDLEIVKELRKHTDALFRVDANCAWTVEQTLAYAPVLKDFNVEFIEQPLKAEQIEDMKKLYGQTALPLMADESCIIETDVERCHGAFDGVNIKLAKCGGISPALRMITNAREKGLKVMMGCMTESSIGISAIAHLSPLLDYVDMDGSMLISNDPATGAYLDAGKIVFSDKNGIGAEWV
jgi:L-Ala-D/L-Glu epimerase